MKFTQLFLVLIICIASACTEGAKVDSTANNESVRTITDVLEQPDTEKEEKKPTEKIVEKKPEIVKPEISEAEKKEILAAKIKQEQKEAAEKKIEAKKAAAQKSKSEKEAKRKAKKQKGKPVKTSASETSDKSSGKPKAEFKETEFNFGVIKQGDKIKHDFVFENTGDKDLEILNVDVTCGCTVPTFPFLPIAPGEKGTIGVTYDSTGKLGNQKPMITVVTNAKPHTYKIYLKGVVDAERAKTKIEDKDSEQQN